MAYSHHPASAARQTYLPQPTLPKAFPRQQVRTGSALAGVASPARQVLTRKKGPFRCPW